MEWVEPVAAFFGLVAVILVVRQNIWCWPTGLIQVALYVFVFFQAKLYSDFLLHIIYVVVQLYGWYHWLHGGANDGELAVSRLSDQTRIGWVVAALAGTAAWGYLMAANTDAAIPYGDAFTTAASLIAMWLQARKRIETWYFWIAVDVVAIGIYYLKGLYWTTGLYGVFLLLCIAGLVSWQKSLPITRVVFLGAPSTGKSSLAKALADRYKTVWMPEYGKEYWVEHQKERRLSPEQLVEIAEGHIEREDALAPMANRFLFVDTEAIVTYNYAMDYHGDAHPRLQQLATEAEQRYDIVFLCADDIPYDDSWERSGKQHRSAFQQQILNDLVRREVPFVTLTGSLEQRMATVCGVIDSYDRY